MRPVRLVAGLLAGLLLALSAPATRAQGGAMAKPVDIPTADYVQLKGHWLPSPKGKEGGTVLLLHGFGEDCKSAGWINLAKALNEKGYAVLRFDFRGHGDSKSVEPGKPDPNPSLAVPGFWDQAENQKGIRGASRKLTEIDAKNFTASYHRILANDVAAAKAFLDKENDAGTCNTSNLILIGAREGATIGALWLNGEYHRFRLVQSPTNPNQMRPDTANPEGKCVTACVWLSISTSFGSTSTGTVNVSPSSMLYKAGATHKTPMLFLYGIGDTKGKATAATCEKALKLDKKNYEATRSLAIPKAEKLTGSALLNKTLITQPAIAEYLDKALEGVNPKAKTRTNEMDVYVWMIPMGSGARQVISRGRGTTLPVFVSYAPFLR
jgi:hypothetical protein